AMHPGPAVGHESRADLGLGAYGAESLAAQAVDGVVEVLNVGPTDAEQVLQAPVAQGSDQSLCQFHGMALPAGFQWMTADAAKSPAWAKPPSTRWESAFSWPLSMASSRQMGRAAPNRLPCRSNVETCLCAGTWSASRQLRRNSLLGWL